ncbi:prostate stem cell antigen-like [Pholidichthys leucotaenia]
MNRVIFQIFAVGFCIALGQALECYKCKLGIADLCLTTKETCKTGEHCFSGVGKAAKVLDIKTKGCLEVAKCNKNEDVNFNVGNHVNATLYKMYKKCCDTDLCNAAPTLPGATRPTLIFTSISALFVAKVLI